MFAITLSCVNKVAVLRPLRYQKRTFQSMYHRGVNFFLKKNLLLTNSITSGLFMGIGDLVQQEIEYHYKIQPNRYDWGRLGRMIIVGTAMGPLHHYYYIYLDKILPKVDMKTVMKKVFYDQAIASPATIIFFLYGMGLLEKKSLAQSNDEIKEKFKYMYMGDWVFWPPVQIINFYYLPTHYRVVYINLATMIFNVFISYIKHYDQH